ncbi:DEAD/DEAH box helicase [Geobacillus stearothermophilus]|uniref:DEAD/DEAH box helicase n=1 Tax=Geobacillus stearothermophilus TaxID=1422 RepID=UPI00051886F7|nr:DEAD/DEAH box helicase [Geobacillus stearothermophilus]MED3664186.1 DEAD/DEAH box helicase [Geobacillus stearothermophilus]MED3720967.1 DEAD/DEAH box helicase [Geobacillus stearothermophilus]MED3730073.1 DEAD/DEAH box helicase [Geobacillus stearothermophilus]MED3732734.1 DEAD/DEAH box helicase [Geobacillus stearothermophilus]MED3740762.1 DEAD/DEAH box helicase [Geobacillus stearothermophilus]
MYILPSSVASPLVSWLNGQRLPREQLPFPDGEVAAAIQTGLLHEQPGLIKTARAWRCVRCGNNDPHLFAAFPCARCGADCAYCRKCLVMGRISSCTHLVHVTMPLPSEPHEAPLAWDGELSAAQAEAAQAVRQAVLDRSELIVWAVCGAGKTEMLFPAIAAALEEGWRVGLATPRVDVVRELAPRFRQAFPRVSLAVWHGGSDERGRIAPLVLSTTHQLLRAYRAFDVMIIDEVDAFPYSVEPMLEYAVSQARKERSSLIYLTATPSRAWQRDIARGKRNAVVIPARYHGHPLPVPVFEWCGNWRKRLERGRLPENVLAWVLHRLEQRKQAFLFVPHIDELEAVTRLLQRVDARIVGVHAEAPDRADHVQAFRDGRVPLLVTTTILERGVTVPNIDVAVLGAEDRIFTESALVQIAGRVGRHAAFPDGDVRFFHHGKTNEMVRARRHIVRMNETAKKRGLLHR